MSVVIPGAFLTCLPDQKEHVLHTFPEAIVNTPVIMGGWLMALFVSSIAYRSHKNDIQRAKNRKLADNS